MPKDNEKIPQFDPGPLKPSEPQGFAPHEMVVCEKCNRSNPPTRANCLYCAFPFAFDATATDLRRPSLRPMEDGELGYCNVVIPAAPVNYDVVAEVGSLLKLPNEPITKILGGTLPLPLTRIASFDEAKLIETRLQQLNISTFIIADRDLRVDEDRPVRVRAAEFSDDSLTLYQVTTDEHWEIPWADITLLVTARLTIKNLVSSERRASRGDTEIVDATETQTDEAVVEIYVHSRQSSFRIAANGFDFSCLGKRKQLLVNENFQQLLKLVLERAPSAKLDDSYKSARAALEQVWPTERRTESQGWRRAGLGKMTFGSVTQVSNDKQFSRYSRFRHYLLQHPQLYEA